MPTLPGFVGAPPKNQHPAEGQAKPRGVFPFAVIGVPACTARSLLQAKVNKPFHLSSSIPRGVRGV